MGRIILSVVVGISQMHIGYIRPRDNHVTNFDFTPLAPANPEEFKIFGPDEELNLPDGEIIAYQGELVTNIGMFRNLQEVVRFVSGPSLVIATNRRIIILRQPGGGLLGGPHTSVRSIQRAGKAQEVSNQGFKEFVSVNFTDTGIKWDLGRRVTLISGKSDRIGFSIGIRPNGKKDRPFYDFLLEHLRSRNEQPRDMKKSSNQVDSTQPSIEEQIPLAGFKKPTFCPICGSKTYGKKCDKCSVSPNDYVSPDKHVPLGMKVGPFILMLTLIAAIFTAWKAWSNGAYSVGAIIGVSTMFWAYYAFKLWQNGRKIKRTGMINCGYCKKAVSPNSKRCVYCGQRISWVS